MAVLVRFLKPLKMTFPVLFKKLKTKILSKNKSRGLYKAKLS